MHSTVPPSQKPECVFSVDVEDWFHILEVPSTPELSRWPSLESRVEKNFSRMLAMFDDAGVRTTCFFLGWVGERFPTLVREAAEQGHEIASHGYSHRPVFSQTPAEFLQDVQRAKQILEDASGRPVLGYRSPGFSVTEDTPWFFDQLIAAGYAYDSSVFPASRGHGGIAKANRAPHVERGARGSITEFPITVAPVAGRPFCFFGGGYLRLFPYFLIRAMSKRVLADGRPVIFYVHPREIDPQHPRLRMNLYRHFKSYVNLHTMEPKIRRILSDFRLRTFEELMQAHNAAAVA
jgi:polysaccharide deacetylase family protein (PEP-CTERM system associated)